MPPHSHFNCCIELALPGHAHGPAYVFHYTPGAVAPTVTERELDDAIGKVLVQLADAPGNLELSVETVLSNDEVAAVGSVPSEQIPTFALMHRRIAFIRERFADRGLPASRLVAHIL